jgi:hypothetical protein
MSKKPLSLPIARIRAERAAQPREFLNESVCREYAELIQAGVQLNRDGDCVAFFDGKTYWLADGFHRLRAHVIAGCKAMIVEVRNGGLRDAILYAVGANATHGLRRTNADKARAVGMLIADKEWCKWSDRAIAEKCRVSHRTVGLHRKRFLAEARDAAGDQQTEARPRTVKYTRKGKVHVRRVHARGTTRDSELTVQRMLETKRENELIAELVNELRSTLTRTELIERLLDELRELHKSHPWRARADQLLDLYKQTVLPWPPEFTPASDGAA